MTRSTLSPRLFFGAAATLALSTMLPWVTISGEHALAGVGWQTKLSSGGVVYLLLFAAAYAGAGHALRQQREVRRWAVGMWVVNGWMALNVIVLASQVKGRHVEDPMHVVGFHSTAGPGVLIASLAVLAGIAGSVALLRPRAARTRDAIAS